MLGSESSGTAWVTPIRFEVAYTRPETVVGWDFRQVADGAVPVDHELTWGKLELLQGDQVVRWWWISERRCTGSRRGRG